MSSTAVQVLEHLERPEPSVGTRVGAGPPKVLFLTHTGRLGGAEFCLLEIVKSFRSGSSVFLFEDGPLRQRLATLEVDTVVAKRAPDFAPIRRDASLLRALPFLRGMASTILDIARMASAYDIVYANSQKAFVLGAVAALLARRPFVWHLHDILTADHFGRGQLAVLPRLANCAAKRIIAVSQAVADAVVHAGGKADRVSVVLNGVSPPEYRDGADPTKLRAELGLPDGFLFGVFSRLSPWKGQDVALRALAHMPEARCVIVGDVLFGEHEYAARLHRLVEELNLSCRVFFLGHRSDVPRLMRMVDAIVHPSTQPEPCALALIEAMFARRPIVAARAGGTPELLEDGRSGILIEAGDPMALASALERIRTQPNLASAMAETAARRAKTLFTADRMVRDIISVLRDLGGSAEP